MVRNVGIFVASAAAIVVGLVDSVVHGTMLCTCSERCETNMSSDSKQYVTTFNESDKFFVDVVDKWFNFYRINDKSFVDVFVKKTAVGKFITEVSSMTNQHMIDAVTVDAVTVDAATVCSVDEFVNVPGMLHTLSENANGLIKYKLDLNLTCLNTTKDNKVIKYFGLELLKTNYFETNSTVEQIPFRETEVSLKAEGLCMPSPGWNMSTKSKCSCNNKASRTEDPSEMTTPPFQPPMNDQTPAHSNSSTVSSTQTPSAGVPSAAVNLTCNVGNTPAFTCFDDYQFDIDLKSSNNLTTLYSMGNKFLAVGEMSTANHKGALVAKWETVYIKFVNEWVARVQMPNCDKLNDNPDPGYALQKYEWFESKETLLILYMCNEDGGMSIYFDKLDTISSTAAENPLKWEKSLLNYGGACLLCAPETYNGDVPRFDSSLRSGSFAMTTMMNITNSTQHGSTPVVPSAAVNLTCNVENTPAFTCFDDDQFDIDLKSSNNLTTLYSMGNKFLAVGEMSTANHKGALVAKWETVYIKFVNEWVARVQMPNCDKLNDNPDPGYALQKYEWFESKETLLILYMCNEDGGMSIYFDKMDTISSTAAENPLKWEKSLLNYGGACLLCAPETYNGDVPRFDSSLRSGSFTMTTMMNITNSTQHGSNSTHHSDP